MQTADQPESAGTDPTDRLEKPVATTVQQHHDLSRSAQVALHRAGPRKQIQGTGDAMDSTAKLPTTNPADCTGLRNP